MKLVCTKCGYVVQAEIHLSICPICKAVMRIIPNK